MRHKPCAYVVDDDDAVRNNLKWLLETVDIEVETFASAVDFLSEFSADRPGCLVLDVRMPGMSGLELQNTLANRREDFPIVFISGHGDVQLVVRAMKMGAVDFIEKPFSNQVVIDAVQGALAGISDTMKLRQRRQDAQSHLDRLTTREREVLDGIIAGQTNKATANALGLSEKTVEVHRARMMDKMGADSLVELIRMVTVLSWK